MHIVESYTMRNHTLHQHISGAYYEWEIKIAFKPATQTLKSGSFKAAIFKTLASDQERKKEKPQL